MHGKPSWFTPGATWPGMVLEKTSVMLRHQPSNQVKALQDVEPHKVKVMQEVEHNFLGTDLSFRRADGSDSGDNGSDEDFEVNDDSGIDDVHDGDASADGGDSRIHNFVDSSKGVRNLREVNDTTSNEATVDKKIENKFSKFIIQSEDDRKQRVKKFSVNGE